MKRFAEREPKAVELYESMEEVKAEAAQFMKVRAVWQFFEAEGKAIRLSCSRRARETPLHTFDFPRQASGRPLCLSDYILPAQNGKRDHVALFVVTAGEGVRERSEKPRTTDIISSRTACRRWPSNRRKLARNGCTGEYARTGDFPIRRI